MGTPDGSRDMPLHWKEIPSSFTHGLLAHLTGKQHLLKYFHFLLSMTTRKYKIHEQWVIKPGPFADRAVIRQAWTKRWVIKKGTPSCRNDPENICTVRFSRHKVLSYGCPQIHS